jgi:hypothetical protein
VAHIPSENGARRNNVTDRCQVFFYLHIVRYKMEDGRWKMEDG